MIQIKLSKLWLRIRNLSLTYVLFIGLCIFILWASIFKLDRVVIVQGQVISALKTQVIQVVDGGVLTDLKVQEGQTVNAGEVVAVLQKDSANAGYQAANAELESSREILASVENELQVNRELLKTGDIAYLEVARLQRQVSELRGKVRVGIQRLAQQELGLERTNLKSPVDGTVKVLKINTLGGVLKPGEEIMEIAPSSDNLVIEVRVNPVDMASLRVGLPATIKLDAFDYSMYGSLNGRLTYIGPDTLTEPGQMGQIVTYYRAHIEIPADQLAGLREREIELKLGMSARADIKTGSRSVLSYIMKPLYKGFGGALKEK